MKTGIFSVAVVALLQLAAAQPHRIQHRHLHAKRDLETSYTTVFVPEVIVWVDREGHTVSVETKTDQASQTDAHQAYKKPTPIAVAPNTTPTTTAASTSNAGEFAEVTTSSPSPYKTVAPPPHSTKKAAPPPSSSAPPKAVSDQGSMLGLGVGVTYSPYNGDGTCKTQSEVNADFDKISGYQIVRMYGVDCNQVVTILSAAKAKGMKVLAGIIDITNVSGDLSTLVTDAGSNLDIIDTVAIGNELVNQGKNSVADVVAAVGAARSQLKSAGYTGNVVTVDTFNAIIDNPQLCEVSDFCAANCHAFFNNEVEASGAGAFVLEQAKLVSAAAGNKNTIITESGWPSQGDSNGAAVPSESNQQAAIASLKASFSGNLFVFNAFNDLWKTNSAGTFNAEQYWGILGTSGS